MAFFDFESILKFVIPIIICIRYLQNKGTYYFWNIKLLLAECVLHYEIPPRICLLLLAECVLYCDIPPHIIKNSRRWSTRRYPKFNLYPEIALEICFEKIIGNLISHAVEIMSFTTLFTLCYHNQDKIYKKILFYDGILGKIFGSVEWIAGVWKTKPCTYQESHL